MGWWELLAQGISDTVNLGSQWLAYGLQKRDQEKRETEARDIADKEWNEDMRRNRFTEGITKREMAVREGQLGLEKNRFGLDVAKTKYQIRENEVNKIQNFLNNNITLRDKVIKMWGRAA